MTLLTNKIRWGSGHRFHYSYRCKILKNHSNCNGYIRETERVCYCVCHRKFKGKEDKE